MKFTEAQLESAIIELIEAEGYPHVLGETIGPPCGMAGRLENRQNIQLEWTWVSGFPPCLTVL